MLTSKIVKIFNKSLFNCSPENLIIKKIKFKNNQIIFKNKLIYKFSNKNIYVISLGKASQSLSNGFFCKTDKINDYFIIRHFDSKKYKFNKSKTIISSHPLVSNKSYTAAKKLLKFIKNIPRGSDVVFLISGGGSAMLAHPIKELNFQEKSIFINNLIRVGIGEREVNYFRKLLSSIKSSKLLSYLNKSNILNLIL